MIREYTEQDKEMLKDYLDEEPYGRVILTAVEEYGTDSPFQTVYLDVRDGKLEGVYLCICRNIMLYCKENKVDIDFLEQMISVMVPDKVAGRKDNVNIVSWLLTDYQAEYGKRLPEVCGENGELLEWMTEEEKYGGEWSVLVK